MGDGRFYSFPQFIEIGYLTIASSILLLLLMYFSFKSRNGIDKWLKHISLSLLLILIALGFRFFESVAYHEPTAGVLRNINIILILMAILVQFYFHGIIGKSIFVSGMMFFLVSRLGVVETYQYNHIMIAIEYKIFLGVLLGAYLLLNLSDLILKKTHWSSIGYPLAVLISGIGYFIRWIFELSIPIEKYFSIIAILILLIMVRRFNPFNVLPFEYRTIIEGMIDSIIILNSEMQVLFANKNALSQYFNLDGSINVFNPHTIIDNITEISEGNDDLLSIIFEKDMQRFYIDYSVKTLEHDHTILGYLIVIQDHTSIEQLLNHLRENTEDLNRQRKELLILSESTNTYAAERERRRLMIEVQNELGHQFAELTKIIEICLNGLEKEDVRPNLELGIKKSREYLRRIRETVSEYRSSYQKKEG